MKNHDNSKKRDKNFIPNKMFVSQSETVKRKWKKGGQSAILFERMLHGAFAALMKELKLVTGTDVVNRDYCSKKNRFAEDNWGR